MEATAGKTRSPAAEAGQLQSFNPASGELVGAVETLTPEQVQGVVDDVAEVQPAWAELTLGDRGRLHAPRRRCAARRPRLAGGAAQQRAGKAAQRGLHDGAAADHRRAALVRRRRAEDPRRREDPLPAGVPAHEAKPLRLRAARRGRRDRALELPLVDPLRRGRDRADGRKRRRSQAGQPDAAARRGDPGSVREGGLPAGPASDRPRRRRGRRRAGKVDGPEDLLHRLSGSWAQGGRGVRRADEGMRSGAGRQGPDDRLRRRQPRPRHLRGALGWLRQRRADLLGDRARLCPARGGRAVRRGSGARRRGASPRRSRWPGRPRSGR